MSWMKVGLTQSFKEVAHSKIVGVQSSLQELAFFWFYAYLYLVLKPDKIEVYISSPFNSELCLPSYGFCILQKMPASISIASLL